MNRIYLLFAVLFVSIPASIEARTILNREDVFTYVWETVKRPVLPTVEVQFTDITPGRSSYDLLRYAKRRGILEDTVSFFPDEPIVKNDLLLWLLRTRNVASIEYVTPESIPMYIAKYTTLQKIQNSDLPTSIGELSTVVQEFDTELANIVHEVSFYSENFHGDGTAFGETFDMNALTAAHPSFPHNTMVRVTNVANNKSVVVRVNDRGPFVVGRSMDLSLAAFLEVSERSKGKMMATIERLGDQSMYTDIVSPTVPTSSSQSSSSSNVSTSSQHSSVNDDLPTNEASVCPFTATVYQNRLTKTLHFTKGVPHVLPSGSALQIAANKFLLIRSITTPSSKIQKVNQWITPQEENFSYTPEELGKHTIEISNGRNRTRTFDFNVQNCVRRLQ